MKRLYIHSVSGIYPVTFSNNIDTDLRKLTKDNSVHLFIDETIYDLYKKTFLHTQQFSSVMKFSAVEKNKSITGVYEYILYLLRQNAKKNHVLLVIGGGLVQDVGSFTAHILFRGMKWIFVPTTLLSMSDSCIGSKSGINVDKYKNQIGAFHAPTSVIIQSRFLKTLPHEMILDGNGEIIKHAIIKGGKIFDYLTKNLANIPKDLVKTQQIIFQSLLVKKEIIEKDELEKGPRRILNYGHTFGHALEGYTNNKIPHGVAVSIGMDMANFISMKRKLLHEEEFRSISALLRSNIPNSTIPVSNVDVYMDYLSHDKKVVGKEVNAILCRGIGNVVIIKISLDNQLKNEIKEYIQKFQLG